MDVHECVKFFNLITQLTDFELAVFFILTYFDIYATIKYHFSSCALRLSYIWAHDMVLR